MMNLLALAGSSYESTARGILYVIYEVMWRIIYYVLTLIDEIAKLFYKVAGINVSEGVVQNKNMFDQLLNQNVISSWYGIFTLIAIGLVIIFSLLAIIRAMANSDRDGGKSVGPILKNIGLASLLLITLGPIILFFISAISNIGIAIASIGGNNNISIGDILFGNSGNLITVYNETFGSAHTSFRDLGKDFLYDLMYNPKEGVSELEFHWYIVLVGGIYVLYNLAAIVIEIVRRIFNIIILYIGSPFAISKIALDDGKSFKAWQSKFLYEFLLLFAQIGTFMIFVALINVLNNMDFEALTGEVVDESINDSLLEPEPGVEEVIEEKGFSLLNGVGRTLIIMTAVNVTRTSATLFAQLLGGKEARTDSLLESLLTRISSRPSGVRTRTITKNSTATRRETVFVDTSSSSSFTKASVGMENSLTRPNNGGSTPVNVNQNITVNNKFSSTNNNTFNNREIKEGVKRGSYGSPSVSPGNVYINASKTVNERPTTTSNSWKFMDDKTAKTATSIVNNYVKANTSLTNAINKGDTTGLQKSLNDYTRAYTKEAELLNNNYRQFESRASASMKSELASQTKQELKNITNAYRKAQVDYSKTATKLKQYDTERISTADALKIKEQADKQRERLMHASNRAAQFYENQKKEE